MSTPSTSGRDAQGRFTQGNKAGRGNPFARRTADLRQAFADAINPLMIHAMAERLYDFAMKGDMAAAKLVLTYLLGKPTSTPDPDTLDQHEWQVRLDDVVLAGEFEKVIEGVPKSSANALVNATLPPLTAARHQELARQLRAEPEEEAPESDELEQEENIPLPEKETQPTPRPRTNGKTPKARPMPSHATPPGRARKGQDHGSARTVPPSADGFKRPKPVLATRT